MVNETEPCPELFSSLGGKNPAKLDEVFQKLARKAQRTDN